MYGAAERADRHWYAWLMWPDGRRKSMWCHTVRGMLDVATAPQTSNANVYYPLACADHPGTAAQRICATGDPKKQVVATASLALAADVDFLGEKHPQAPAGEDEALSLIADFPLRPTIIVNSGNGLQAIWVLGEPATFEGDAARVEFQELARGWGALLLEIAGRRGYKLDSVHDLARVMRWPGSTNVKDPNAPKPVRIVEFAPDQRPTMAEIEALAAPPGDFSDETGETASPGAKAAPGSPMTTTRPAERVSGVPWEKFNVMEVVSPEFADTIYHRRKDLAGRSLSEWDMSIANQLVAAGWTDDEIVATLAYHRERYGNREKLPRKRPDYYATTIRKARAYQSKRGAISDPAADRAAKIVAVAEELDIPLTNIQLITGPPGVYRLWVENLCVEVPDERMLQQNYVAAKIFSLARRAPKPIAPSRKKGAISWQDIANAISAAAEEIEGDPETTLDGEIWGLVEGFSEGKVVSEIPPGQLVENDALPFVRGDRLWFRVEALRAWMRGNDIRMRKAELLSRLTALGGIARNHKVRVGRSEKIAKRFWGVPRRTRAEDEDESELPLT